jgi:hypothetical protein
MKENYVKKLTDEDVVKLVAHLGYVLQPFLESRRTGEPLPAIERYEDEDKKECLFVRCIKTQKKFDKLFDMITDSKLLQMAKQITNNYMDGNGFLMITDFTLSEHFMDDMFSFHKKEEEYENSSECKYINFMVEKFGEEYITDYNNFADEFNAKLEQQRKEEQAKEEQNKQAEEKQTTKEESNLKEPEDELEV